MWEKTAERSMTLYELLGKMQPRARQDIFEFADFWEVMEKRGFGPMLALPSFIACTPIGAIPGIPSLAGGTILLIALQILLGRRHPWLPKKVLELQCDADQLRYIVGKVKPIAVRVDRFLVPRCFFMRQTIFRSFIALCCVGCGIVMIPLELIPFMGLVPAFAVFIMAIGMATDDGAVALVGVSLSLFGFVLGFEQLATAVG
ncbi:exopolysaccharide biosynthesis protein [Alteromonas gracilis]|uniref:exopolysaccharide biosynthesis protein n=1 Tax=Alteromonas gracilis TaxID=1479524 RepID=UPI0037364520